MADREVGRVWIFWAVLAVGVAITALLPFLNLPPLIRSSQAWEAVTDPGLQREILWQMRIPRVLLGFVGGAALAVSGLVFQAVFRNTLATPFTLGVSSGASLGTALAVKLGVTFTVLGFSGITFFSFAGAALTILVVFGLSTLRKDFTSEMMLLGGVAMSFFFTALILFIQYLSDFAGALQIMRWMMGDLNVIGFERPAQVAILLVPCLAVLAIFSSDLNLLLTGEELARTRGVNVVRVKVVTLLVVSALTGVVVAFCGPIGFVGMMIPHLLRLALGPSHRRLLWATVVAGGCFLAVSDFLARTLIAPAEIPVGILTSLLGGPFFLWLLLGPRRRRFFWN